MKHGEDDTAQLTKDTNADTPQGHIGQTMVGENQTLRDSIEVALDNYFTHLDGQMASDLYNMVLAEVELPLLQAVLRYTRNNQTRASTILGLNRGTLRKKLKQYDLL